MLKENSSVVNIVNCATVWEMFCCRTHLTFVVRHSPAVMKCSECRWVIKLIFSSMITAWYHCLLMRTTLEPFHIRQGLWYVLSYFVISHFETCRLPFMLSPWISWLF